MSDKNIIELKSAQRSLNIKSKSINQRMCRHSRSTIDQSRRVIVCDLCNLVIEPYEFILMWAKKEVNLASRIGDLQNEYRRAYGELEELKRQKKNLKAQVDRLAKKL